MTDADKILILFRPRKTAGTTMDASQDPTTIVSSEITYVMFELLGEMGNIAGQFIRIPRLPGRSVDSLGGSFSTRGRGTESSESEIGSEGGGGRGVAGSGTREDEGGAAL